MSYGVEGTEGERECHGGHVLFSPAELREVHETLSGKEADQTQAAARGRTRECTDTPTLDLQASDELRQGRRGRFVSPLEGFFRARQRRSAFKVQKRLAAHELDSAAACLWRGFFAACVRGRRKKVVPAISDLSVGAALLLLEGVGRAVRVRSAACRQVGEDEAQDALAVREALHEGVSAQVPQLLETGLCGLRLLSAFLLLRVVRLQLGLQFPELLTHLHVRPQSLKQRLLLRLPLLQSRELGA